MLKRLRRTVGRLELLLDVKDAFPRKTQEQATHLVKIKKKNARRYETVQS
jgi:hypothetical protein